MKSDNLVRLVDFIGKKVELAEKLNEPYRYQSLPLCVVDAVFSLGVRYGQVKKVVNRFCDENKWQKYRAKREILSPSRDQKSIDDFLKIVDAAFDFKNGC